MVSVNRKDVDGGWAWVVLFGSFVCSAISCGHLVNSAIFFVTFVNAFGQSRTYTAWIITVQGMALHTAGPLSSLVLAKFGPRVTMMSGGLVAATALATGYFARSVIEMTLIFAFTGVGVSMLLTSSLSPMAFYFRRHFNVATGLTNSGAGFGVIFMGVLLEWAIQSFGWRGAMLIQSGVMLQAVVCGALIYDTSPISSSTLERSKKSSFDSSVFRDVRLQLLFASFLLYYFYYNVLLLIMKDDFESRAFSVSYEAVILCLGLTNTLGRLTSGFSSEYLLAPPMQLFVASALAAVALLSLVFARVQWAYLASFALIGFANGQQVILQNLSLAYVFGRSSMQVLWGCGLCLGALAYIGGSPVAGYVMDVSGSYDGVFVMTSTASLMCGLLNALCYVIHRRRLTAADNSIISVSGEREPLKPVA